MFNNRSVERDSWLVGAGIALILVTGLIHLIEGPGNFSEAAYKGYCFS